MEVSIEYIDINNRKGSLIVKINKHKLSAYNSEKEAIEDAKKLLLSNISKKYREIRKEFKTNNRKQAEKEYKIFQDNLKDKVISGFPRLERREIIEEVYNEEIDDYELKRTGYNGYIAKGIVETEPIEIKEYKFNIIKPK